MDRQGRPEAKAAAERAQGYFEEGYNCCQSVFLVFGKRYGFDRELSCRLAASFGGGVGRLRQVCGAVSAMALVCGLETGAVTGDDQEGKAYNYEKMQRLAARFERERGSLICRELLGLDRPAEEKALAGKHVSAGEALSAEEDRLREAMEGGMGKFRPQARDEAYYATRPCGRLIGLAAEILEEWLAERSLGCREEAVCRREER